MRQVLNTIDAGMNTAITLNEKWKGVVEQFELAKTKYPKCKEYIEMILKILKSPEKVNKQIKEKLESYPIFGDNLNYKPIEMFKLLRIFALALSFNSSIPLVKEASEPLRAIQLIQ